MTRTNPKPCKFCGQIIYFETSIRTDSDRLIPLQIKHEGRYNITFSQDPHDCPSRPDNYTSKEVIYIDARQAADRCPDCNKYFRHEASSDAFTCWKCDKTYCEACFIRGKHTDHNSAFVEGDYI